MQIWLSIILMTCRHSIQCAHGVELASRPNSTANGDAAVFLGLGDETGKEGNIVDGGEEQKDEKIGGHMRSVPMFSCSHVLMFPCSLCWRTSWPIGQTPLRAERQGEFGSVPTETEKSM